MGVSALRARYRTSDIHSLDPSFSSETVDGPCIELQPYLGIVQTHILYDAGG